MDATLTVIRYILYDIHVLPKQMETRASSEESNKDTVPPIPGINHVAYSYEGCCKVDILILRYERIFIGHLPQ